MDPRRSRRTALSASSVGWWGCKFSVRMSASQLNVAGRNPVTRLANYSLKLSDKKQKRGQKLSPKCHPAKQSREQPLPAGRWLDEKQKWSVTLNPELRSVWLGIKNGLDQLEHLLAQALTRLSQSRILEDSTRPPCPRFSLAALPALVLQLPILSSAAGAARFALFAGGLTLRRGIVQEWNSVRFASKPDVISSATSLGELSFKIERGFA